ncbi:MAG: tetratricopeptide repeat protein [Gammaproteobacteria bacterium]|nr:tetratricopeptide repeat protein [Gammaproteobacteria bacterium]
MRFNFVLRRCLEHKRLALIAVLGLATACSVAPKQQSQDTASESKQVEQVDAVKLGYKAGLGNDLYYNLITAELAGQHKDFENAAQSYRRVLKLTDSDDISQEDQYRIARRAWEMGRYIKNADLAELAAQTWQGSDQSFTPRLARIVAVEDASPAKQQQVLAEVFDLAQPQRAAFAAVVAKHYRESPAADAALQMIDGFLETHPNDADVLKAGAVIAEDTDATAMAYQLWYRLSAVATSADEVFDAQAHAAANLRLLGEPAEAANRLRGLHALQPDQHWVALEYGRSLLQSEQAEEALEVLEVLADKLSINPEVQYITGFAAFVAKDYLKAATYFETALAKGYSDHEARYWIGLAYMQAEQPKQGVVWLSTLGQGKHWQRAQHLTGDALAEMGEWEEFETHYNNLRSATPDQAARWFLAQCQSLIDVGRYEQAASYIDKAVEADDEDLEVRYQRGVLYAELGRFQQAETDLNLVITNEPEHAEAMNALGYMLIDRLGDTERGVPLVKRALDLRPESAPIMDSYGWGLLLEGQLREALFWLERAWSNTKDHEIGAHLGEALWLSKRHKEARVVWAEAQNLPRGNRDDKVRQAYERLGIDPE